MNEVDAVNKPQEQGQPIGDVMTEDGRTQEVQPAPQPETTPKPSEPEGQPVGDIFTEDGRTEEVLPGPLPDNEPDAEEPSEDNELPGPALQKQQDAANNVEAARDAVEEAHEEAEQPAIPQVIMDDKGNILAQDGLDVNAPAQGVAEVGATEAQPISNTNSGVEAAPILGLAGVGLAAAAIGKGIVSRIRHKRS